MAVFFGIQPQDRRRPIRWIVILSNLIILAAHLSLFNHSLSESEAFLITAIVFVACCNLSIAAVFHIDEFNTEISRDIWMAVKFLALGGNVALFSLFLTLGMLHPSPSFIVVGLLFAPGFSLARQFSPAGVRIRVLNEKSRLWNEGVDIKFQQAMIARSTVFPSIRIYQAAFLGGPAAGFWLLSKNYKAFRKPGAAFLTFWTGMIITAIVMQAAPHIMPVFPKPFSQYSFAIITGSILAMFARVTQDSSVEEAVALGASKGGRWFVVWTSLVWAIGTIAATIAIGFLRWRFHF